MNTRIRFKYDTKDVKTATYGTSKQTFRVNGTDVQLFVHFKDKYFEIYNVKDQSLVVKGGETKSRTVLLQKARQALIDLGCDFNTEKRNRGNTSETQISQQA